MEPAYLVVDKREREVIPHLAPLLGDRAVEHTINTGDYLICRREGGAVRTVACIERKTIKDFVSSFKDGRYENREKMIKLRSQTGCQLYYLVEGPAYPTPAWQCGRGVQYKSILKAMTTLPLASGIHILQTKDAQHTAERLRDFVEAASELHEPYQYPADAGTAAQAPAVAADLVPEVVTGAYEKDPDTLCMELWKRLPGIAVTTAKLLVKTCSVEEFLDGRGPNPSTFKTPSGRKLAKKGREALARLKGGFDDVAIKVLSGVSGVSLAMATQILDDYPRPPGGESKLLALCQNGESRLAAVLLQQKGRTVKLGLPRAGQILKMLRWKSGAEAGPQQAAANQPPADPLPQAGKKAPAPEPAPRAEKEAPAYEPRFTADELDAELDDILGD